MAWLSERDRSAVSRSALPSYEARQLIAEGDTLMTARTIGMLVAFAALAVLGACASTGTTEPRRTTCRPAGAAALVGKTAPDDATIMRSTESSIVRRIAPGDATTKDYRAERITVTIAEDRVIAAFCG